MRIHRRPGPRLRRRLVVSVGARLHLSRGRTLRRIAAALRVLARAVPGQRERQPQHRPRLLRDRRQRGRDRDALGLARRLRPARAVPLPPGLAPGALRASSAAGRERALTIHERDIAPSSNPRLAMIDGSALLWRFGLYDYQKGPLPWRAAGRPRDPGHTPGFHLRRRPRRPRLRVGRRRRGAIGADQRPGTPAAKGHPMASVVAVPWSRAAAFTCFRGLSAWWSIVGVITGLAGRRARPWSSSRNDGIYYYSSSAYDQAQQLIPPAPEGLHPWHSNGPGLDLNNITVQP